MLFHAFHAKMLASSPTSRHTDVALIMGHFLFLANRRAHSDTAHTGSHSLQFHPSSLCLVSAGCSTTGSVPLLGRWAEKGLYGKLASIVAMASAFIFAHEAAIKDISRLVLS